MLSLPVLVFLVHLAIYLVNKIGTKTINDLLWQLVGSLPIASSQQIKDQTRLRRDVVRLKREMNSISAQDDFARWAKVRREHDKVLAAHDKAASDVQTSRSSFDTTANVLRWISTSGLKYFLQFWFGKMPMFDLPPGWFPWYVEWVLGFPRCPYGGISINVWGSACATVIGLAGDGIGWVILQFVSTGQQAQQQPQQQQQREEKKKEAKKI